MEFHFQWDTLPCRDNLAVMTIQDRFHCFFIHQLFLCEHSTFPVIISSTRFSSSTHEKTTEEQRNHEASVVK